MEHGSERKRSTVLEAIAPNLIPMVDIMFLLLLFLMLGSDMGQSQLEDVVLPHAPKLLPAGDGPATIVNVFHRDSHCRCDGDTCLNPTHWAIGIRGALYGPDAIETLLKSEARSGGAERGVLIRADRAARYGIVGKVLEACSAAGIDRVEIGAAEAAPGGA
jgi:biopolymer transport protein ExbD